MAFHDLTARIETPAGFQEHTGVRLQNLLAALLPDEHDRRRDELVVNGELVVDDGRARTGHAIEIVATAHDASGRVLCVLRERIDSDAIHGFSAFALSGYQPLAGLEIAAIKVYPQRG